MMYECKGTKKINSCKKKKTKNINTRKYSIDIGKNIIEYMSKLAENVLGKNHN